MQLMNSKCLWRNLNLFGRKWSEHIVISLVHMSKIPCTMTYTEEIVLMESLEAKERTRFQAIPMQKHARMHLIVAENWRYEKSENIDVGNWRWIIKADEELFPSTSKMQHTEIGMSRFLVEVLAIIYNTKYFYMAGMFKKKSYSLYAKTNADIFGFLLFLQSLSTLWKRLIKVSRETFLLLPTMIRLNAV